MQRRLSHQKGEALIVVLLLLTISLMVGLSSMQTSQIDERLAGNYKAATEAQMNAEAAASEMFSSIASYFPPGDAADLAEGFSWQEFSEFSDSSTECQTDRDNRLSCFLTIPAGGRFGKESGDYIIAMGVVEDAESESEPVFIRLEKSDFSNMSPLTVVQSMDSFTISNSNNFAFDGKNIVPDMTVSESDDGDLSGKDYLANGTVSSDFSSMSLLGDPEGFVSFIKKIKNEAVYYSGGQNKKNFVGNDDGPQISFYDGDLSNNNISGKGVLVVNGDYLSNGNPSFDGLVIVLGNHKPGSGGGGGDLEGALVIAPFQEPSGSSEPKKSGVDNVDEIDCSSGCEFRKAEVDFGTGGGNMQFNHNSENLKTAFSLLSDEAKMLWSVNDNQSGAVLGIAEWR